MVFKHCPKLLLWLWKILRVIWRRGKILMQWRIARGIWIPKVENFKQIIQFRIVSPLILFVLSNDSFIDTSFRGGYLRNARVFGALRSSGGKSICTVYSKKKEKLAAP